MEIFSGNFPVGPKKRGYRITKERDANTGGRMDVSSGKERGGGKSKCRHEANFFWLGAAWVKSRAERPSVSGVSRQLHVQIGWFGGP